jgi:hypothetical protein
LIISSGGIWNRYIKTRTAAIAARNRKAARLRTMDFIFAMSV